MHEKMMSTKKLEDFHEFIVVVERMIKLPLESLINITENQVEKFTESNI